MRYRPTSRDLLVKAALAGLSAATLGLSALATSALAQTPPTLKAATTTTASTASYWTPARLANAKPLNLIPDLKNVKQVSAFPGKASAPIPAEPPEKVPFDPAAVLGKSDLLPQTAGTIDEVAPALIGSFGRAYTTNRFLPISGLGKYYPYRTVGQLFFTTPSGDSWCTASVIRKRVIVTAGHCVSDGVGHFYTNWVFVPSRYDALEPYNRWTWNLVTTTNNWFNGGGGVPNVQDVALIRLNDRLINGGLWRIGTLLGTLGYQYNAPLPTHITQIGYPQNLDSGTKPSATYAELYASRLGTNNYEWGSAQRGGSSGGPEVQDFGLQPVGLPAPVLGGNIVVSVTSYGYISTAPQVQGGSIFKPAGYAGHGLGDLLNTACAGDTRNCN
jgi:hypothetical protein